MMTSLFRERPQASEEVSENVKDLQGAAINV